MKDNNYAKFSIDLPVVDLGKIEYLAERGFYRNRAEFVRTAINNELLKHEEWLDREITVRKMDVGVINLRREDLDALRKRIGFPYYYFVIGRLRLDPSVTLPDMMCHIRKLLVFGKLECSPDIHQHYEDETRYFFY
ncbi:MAG: hypothetical protein ACOYJO_02385 [Eubacterium sp.]|jgi:Arc/MetJ-type ribon-helix-helix transcriptional regulator